jgi:phosphoadenosine phosphosulfate reductase
MTPEEVKALASAWEEATPEALLAFAFERFPKIAISTAFGPEGCALIAMAVAIRPDVPVFTVDTDFLFPESIALRQQFVDKYRINLTVLKGAVTLVEQDRKYGLKLYERDSDQCCALRKVEPTGRALGGLDAWVAGLRRDQGRSRSDIAAFELYDRPGAEALVKINPLRRWTRRDTWDYLLGHGVPYNALLDQGYKSIGCWPCTRPVKAGEEERAGRWGGAKQECGIHTFMARKD